MRNKIVGRPAAVSTVEKEGGQGSEGEVAMAAGTKQGSLFEFLGFEGLTDGPSVFLHAVCMPPHLFSKGFQKLMDSRHFDPFLLAS